MAANTPFRPDLNDPESEVEFLIEHLSALEAITGLGGPTEHVQFTANELHGMFRTLKIQVQRIGQSLEAR